MRKNLFFIASLVMIFSMVLAACATPTPQVVIQTAAPVVLTQVVEKEVTVAAPTQEPVEPTATPYPVARVEGGKIPIYWYVGLGTGGQPDQIKVEEEVIATFNAMPERAQDKIQLILNVVPYVSSRDTLSTLIASGNAPDIAGPVGGGGANSFYGQWLDLTPLIEETKYDLTQFDPALVTMLQSLTGQAQEALPFAVYPSATFYTAALFNEAGLNYPPAKYGEKYKWPDGTEVEWNWDTLAQVARLLTIDSAGMNSTEAGFDRTKIVQYGYTWAFENNVLYPGAHWQPDSLVAPGGSRGAYKSQIPDEWKAAWKWTYDGIWGPQPFMPNGQVGASVEFGYSNAFGSGKVAMTVEPLWTICCIDKQTNTTWDVAAIPTHNGRVSGRMDADAFRILKASAHPKEAFTVLMYLISPEAVAKLAPSYSAFPARISDQGPFFEAKKAEFPWVKNWEVFVEGLKYPDVPSAEAWMPNFSEAYNRGQTFFSLMENESNLDLDKEIAKFQSDMDVIFNK